MSKKRGVTQKKTSSKSVKVVSKSSAKANVKKINIKKKVKATNKVKKAVKAVQASKTINKQSKLNPDIISKSVSKAKSKIFAKPAKKISTQSLSIISSTPLAFKILIFYSFTLLILNLLYAYFLDNILFLGVNISGVMAKFLYVTLSLILCVLIYFFLHPSSKGFYFAILWYIFSIIDSFVSLLALDFINFNSTFFVFIMLIIMFINGLTLGYISMKKNYFFTANPNKINKNGKELLHYEDKLFITVLSIFMVFITIVVLIFSYNFFNSTKANIDLVSSNLNHKNILDAEVICASYTGDLQDVCYVVLASSTRAKTSSDYCSYIRSDIYKYICIKAVK